MKKRNVLVVLLLLICALLCACNSEEEQALPPSGETGLAGTDIVIERDSPELSGMQYSQPGQVIYSTYEKLAASANEVVVAEYITAESYNQHFNKYHFKLEKRYFGEGKETDIDVWVMNYSVDLGASDYKPQTPFKAGHKYLLLLSRIYTPFSEGSRLEMVNEGMVIPFEDIKGGMLYGQPLSEHVSGFAVDDSTTADAFITYTLSLTKDNAVNTGIDFITSDNISEIIAQSTFVAVVTINEIKYYGYMGDSNTYMCTVDDTLKGDIKPGTEAEMFLPSSAEAGKTYIVSFKYFSDSQKYFIVSSVNSVYDISLKDEIVKSIKK